MKKTSYVCAPWLSVAYKVGAVLLIAGYLLGFILRHEYFTMLLEGEYYEDMVLMLLQTALPILFGGMLFCYEKYDLRYIAALFLGYGILENGGLSLACLKDIFVIFPLLLLVASIGGKWNVSIRVGVLKVLATPWLCLLGAVAAALISVLALKGENFSKAVICLGYAVVFFFSQPMPRTSIRKGAFYHSYLASGDMTSTLGGVFLALSLVAVCLYSGTFLGIEGFASPLMSMALILLVFEGTKVLSIRYRNLYWLALVFLFMITGSMAYGEYSYLLYIYLLLILSAIGFSGNDPVISTGKFDFTVFELVAFFFLCLYTVCAVYRLGYGVYEILAEQPHIMTKAYKIDCMDTVLRYVRALLALLCLLLSILSSGTEIGENGVAWLFKTVIGWVKRFAEKFQKDSGRKIQKLSYVLSYVFIALTALAVFGLALSLAAGILTKLSYAAATLLPVWKYFTIAGVCFGFAASCAISAVTCWFLYSFGQITSDVHSLPKMLVSKTVNKASKADDLLNK